MKSSVFVLAVLLIPVAFASIAEHLEDEKYIIVVQDDAPAVDVVFAANFGQTLKANTGVTFVGASEKDVKGATEAELRKKVLITLDGDSQEATIAVGADVSASAVVKEAKRYLSDNGYEVTVEEGGEESSSSKKPSAKTVIKPIEEEPVPKVEVPVVKTPTVVVDERTTVTVNNTSVVMPEPIVLQIKEDESKNSKESGSIFSSLWDWIKDLFR